MLEMIQKHTLIDSDNWGLINSMVERSREMLMQSEDASTSRVGPSVRLPLHYNQISLRVRVLIRVGPGRAQ